MRQATRPAQRPAARAAEETAAPAYRRAASPTLSAAAAGSEAEAEAAAAVAASRPAAASTRTGRRVAAVDAGFGFECAEGEGRKTAGSREGLWEAPCDAVFFEGPRLIFQAPWGGIPASRAGGRCFAACG